MRKTGLSEQSGHHEAKMGSERSFGVVFAIVFAIIGTVPLLRGSELRLWSLLIAAVFLAFGLIAPRVLRPLNILWFKFGLLLGRIIAPIVISLLFFIAVTPTALIMRLLRKDVLSLRFDRNAKSYWISRSRTNNPMGSMKNQF
jgi:Saxitoxin biosynthesis operon protein SxtJ